MFGKKPLLKKSPILHVSRNIATEAFIGMNEISNHVEHYGPQMTELAEQRLRPALNVGAGAQNVATSGPAGATMATRADFDGSVMSSNIVDDIIPIIVTRNSYNLVGKKLPFILFAPVNLIEEYSSIFGRLQNLPVGVTCSTSVFQNRALRFTYTDGVDTDTIDVTTDFAVNYPTILKMLETDYFVAKGVKYTAESGNFDAQFNSFSLQAGRSTIFGVANLKGYPVSSFKRADQNQDNIVNLDATLRLNGRRFISLGMAGAPPALATSSIIKLDVFVTKYGSSVDFEPSTCN